MWKSVRITTTTHAPAVSELLSEHAHRAAADEFCIFCPCRPNVSLCGRYQEGELEIIGLDGKVCVECLRVDATGCPGCGCYSTERCEKCDDEK